LEDWDSSCWSRFSSEARSKTLQEVVEFVAGGGQALGDLVECGHGGFLCWGIINGNRRSASLRSFFCGRGVTAFSGEAMDRMYRIGKMYSKNPIPFIR
jgi:hypothetical protein